MNPVVVCLMLNLGKDLKDDNIQALRRNSEPNSDLLTPADVIFNWCTGFKVPHWIDSKSCFACTHCGDKLKSRSTHNCRLCGFVYCSRCTSKLNICARLELKDKTGPSRVCYGCKFRCIAIRDLHSGLHNTRHVQLFSLPRDIGFTQQACEVKIKALEELEAKYLQGEPIYAPETWEDAEGFSGTCPKCSTKARHSKHNCRVCGDMYCSDCAEKMDIELPSSFNKKNKVGPQRVCDECRFRVLAGGVLLEGSPDCNESLDNLAIDTALPATIRGIPALGLGAKLPTLEQVRDAKSKLVSRPNVNEANFTFKSPKSLFDQDPKSCLSSPSREFVKVRLRKNADFKALTAFNVCFVSRDPICSPVISEASFSFSASDISGNSTPRTTGSNSSLYQPLGDFSPLTRPLKSTPKKDGASKSPDLLVVVPLSDEDHSLSYSVIQGGIEQKMQLKANEDTLDVSACELSAHMFTLADFHKKHVLKRLPRILVEVEEIKLRRANNNSKQSPSDYAATSSSQNIIVKIEESEWKLRTEKMLRKCDKYITYYDQKGSSIDRSMWSSIALKDVAGDVQEVVFDGPFVTDESTATPSTIWTDDENSSDYLAERTNESRFSPRSMKPIALLSTAPKLQDALPLSPSFSGFDSPSLLSPRGTGPRSTFTTWSTGSGSTSPSVSLTTSTYLNEQSNNSPKVGRSVNQNPRMSVSSRRGGIISNSRMLNQIQQLNEDSDRSDDCENLLKHKNKLDLMPLQRGTSDTTPDISRVVLKLADLQLMAKSQNSYKTAVEMTTLTPRAKALAEKENEDTNL